MYGHTNDRTRNNELDNDEAACIEAGTPARCAECCVVLCVQFAQVLR